MGAPSFPGTRPTALVTGASSGIGREIALILAQRPCDLVLVARGREAMEEVAARCRKEAGINAMVLSADLSDAASPQRIYDQLQGAGTAIDILVNNAGFGIHGRFVDTEIGQDLALLQVNMVSLTHLTRLFLPGMVQRGWGRVLDVASTAAFVPGPFMGLYYASKAYVLSHSLALGYEMRSTGVRVTCLCPGPTATDFQRRAQVETSRLFKGHVMDARTVAMAGCRAMWRGKALVIPGLNNRLSAFGARFAPHWVLTAAAASFNRDRGTRKAQEPNTLEGER